MSTYPPATVDTLSPAVPEGQPLPTPERPIGRFELGDRVRIHPGAVTAYAGERGVVVGMFHVGGPNWTVTVRLAGRVDGIPFASSQVELSEVQDRIMRDFAQPNDNHGIGCPERYDDGDCDGSEDCKERQAERTSAYYDRAAGL